MEFRLVYDGPLKSNGGISEKQSLRRTFHVQLKELIHRKAMEPFKRLVEAKHVRATLIEVAGLLLSR